MIQFECPRCGEKMEVPVSMAGQKEACPACGNIALVPGVSSGQPAPPVLSPIMPAVLPVHEAPPQSRGLSKSAWLFIVLGIWCAVWFLLVIAMVAFYQRPMDPREAYEDARSKALGGLSPREVASGVWCCCFSFVWLVGAIPLLIAAIATRRK